MRATAVTQGLAMGKMYFLRLSVKYLLRMSTKITTLANNEVIDVIFKIRKQGAPSKFLSSRERIGTYMRQLL